MRFFNVIINDIFYFDLANEFIYFDYKYFIENFMYII